ncbi:MAG: sugar phosphate isomerase/epimerase [Bryobacteraceae bacterium]
MITRRSFSAGLAGSIASASAFAARFTKPLGVQLYTVRDVMPKQPKETIQEIAKIGFKEIEGTWAGFENVLPMLREAGLKPVSLHVPGALATGNWKAWGSDPMTWEQVAAKVKGWGIPYMVIPYVRPDERGKTLDHYRKFSDELNKGGEAAAKMGLKLAYHNHAFEFAPMEGSSPFQVMMERTTAKVGLEMDVFWVTVAGQDPLALLGKYKGRVPLVHLKDMAKGTANRYDERVERTAFKEVGNGTLDFGKILKAGRAAGVVHYFVEQDQCPGNPLDSLRQSYQAVRKLAL